MYFDVIYLKIHNILERSYIQPKLIKTRSYSDSIIMTYQNSGSEDNTKITYVLESMKSLNPFEKRYVHFKSMKPGISELL